MPPVPVFGKVYKPEWESIAFDQLQGQIPLTPIVLGLESVADIAGARMPKVRKY